MMRWNPGSLSCVKQVSLQNIGSKTLRVLAKSQHIQNKLLVTLNILETKMKAPTKIIRKKLKLELLQTIKIYTEETATADVNVNKAFKSGQSQLKSFKESLPEGFRSAIKKLVVPIGSKTKQRSKTATEES